MAADQPPVAYSFSTLDLENRGDNITYTFMCQTRRFIVLIAVDDLDGDGDLVDTFTDFSDNLNDDPDLLNDFETWVLDALNDDINLLIPYKPEQLWKPTTLQEYFGAETFVFKLFNQAGNLKGLRQPYDPATHGSQLPRCFLVDELMPQGTETELDEKKRQVISKTSLPPIPVLPASQLVNAAAPDSFEVETSSVPRLVRIVGTNQEFFFKPAAADHGFPRELDHLGKILRLTHPPKTSRLVGLVQWDGEDALLGMLLEHIDGRTLQEAAHDASVSEKEKWLGQIETTIHELHKHEIVWGDAKPDNVMIDSSGDAVVIDFGGGFDVVYFEGKWLESKKADTEGLKRMRRQLIWEGDQS